MVIIPQGDYRLDAMNAIHIVRMYCDQSRDRSETDHRSDWQLRSMWKLSVSPPSRVTRDANHEADLYRSSLSLSHSLFLFFSPWSFFERKVRPLRLRQDPALTSQSPIYRHSVQTHRLCIFISIYIWLYRARSRYMWSKDRLRQSPPPIDRLVAASFAPIGISADPRKIWPARFTNRFEASVYFYICHLMYVYAYLCMDKVLDVKHLADYLVTIPSRRWTQIEYIDRYTTLFR